MTVAVSLSFSLDLDDLKDFLQGYAGDVPEVNGGVAAYGEPAAYALVWEYGNLRQKKQGPRTVRGTNPDGESVWLSSQAPLGYVSVHENDFWAAINSRLEGMSLDGDLDDWSEEMKSAIAMASQDIAGIIRENAPIGIGTKRHPGGGGLQGSIEAMSPDDPDLQGSFDTNPDVFLNPGTVFEGVA